jgi:squalene-hopene/tetraprenyl-beta-curcumene cyclase
MDSNPGLGDTPNKKGLFYYYLAMSRGLNAWGSSTLAVKQGDQTVKRDWANDLIDELAKIQNKDGSWKNTERQWMEDQPDLATAYAIISLNNAID